MWVGGLQLVGSAFAEIIKQLVGRSRPLHQLVPDSGYSFPSGHTFCTTVLVITLLILCLPQIKDQENQLIAIVIGVVWIGMVAASRVYLRDHYASDVIASLLLAGGYLLIIAPYAEAVQSKLRSILPERILKPWTPKN
ncbi:phosphatase PAP2 family protein [Lacticaseibacillus thailandensis]|uniref:phosphatase PAP2 family protein n=1 Tax=Lacticaseibacillus thailandensis TaxID=381741 RepID=UPI001CDABB0E|nr:phosphatase PAP2 family protein [Lacticaseibacillus thailandensis]